MVELRFKSVLKAMKGNKLLVQAATAAAQEIRSTIDNGIVKNLNDNRILKKRKVELNNSTAANEEENGAPASI